MLNIKIHGNICQTFLLPNEKTTLQCRASSCTHVHQWKRAASVCSSNAALKPESRVQIFPLSDTLGFQMRADGGVRGFSNLLSSPCQSDRCVHTCPRQPASVNAGLSPQDPE